MSRAITIDARWDDQAAVWLATSADVHGLVVEAESWSTMIDEVRLILPELLALEGEASDDLSVTFRRSLDDAR
jgi:Domain of unknown function (DUF1902)